MSFGGLVSRNKVFSESSHRIEINLDVVVEGIEFQISVSCDFYLDEEFIEFW